MKPKRVLVVMALVLALAALYALGAGKPPERRVINLPAHPAELPFSDAVLVGDTLYLAGNIGLDPKTRRPPDDIELEARLLLDSMKATLEAAGMTMDDLVTVTVYCPDLTLYAKFNSIYRTYFSKEFPARAFIGSGPLLFGGHFEVQAMAVRR